MERRTAVVSALTAAFAFVLFGLYPGAYKTTASSVGSGVHDWIPLLAPTRVWNDNEPSSSTGGLWDILYHLGGNGPWIPKVRNTTEESIEPPEECWVDQVHMVGLWFREW